MKAVVWEIPQAYSRVKTSGNMYTQRIAGHRPVYNNDDA
jgi:hypothetical protein